MADGAKGTHVADPRHQRELQAEHNAGASSAPSTSAPLACRRFLMLANNRGRGYDVFEGGERVLSVRYLNQEEPVTCCICERPTFSTLAVPYYCGAVREGCSEGGYSHACERCYARWERWNDAGMARFCKPAHGGYPDAARGVKGTFNPNEKPVTGEPQ
jgi:hypothetical protein